MTEDRVIFTRTYDLLAWLLPKTQTFPRAYRFSLVQRLTNHALDFQDGLIAAQSCRGRDRIAALRVCDLRLQQVTVYLRLAHQWQWISDGQYRHVSQMLLEIGKLLGGWLKHPE